MSDTNLNMINMKITALHEDVGEMRVAMRDLVSAITKLALVEERQIHANSAIMRVEASVADIGKRVRTLEDHAPLNNKTTDWIDRGVLVALGVLVTAFITKVF